MTVTTNAIASYVKPTFISKRYIKFEVSDDVYDKYKTTGKIDKRISSAVKSNTGAKISIYNKGNKVTIR